jgi:threonine synthase
MLTHLETPMHYSDILSRHYQTHIWLKLELFNSTGTHKDRESRQIVKDCLNSGCQEIGCASSGNFGISLAYHSWQVGLTCHVWVSSKVSKIVSQFLEAFSAHIYMVDASLSDLYEISSEALNRMSAYNANPYYCQSKIR